MGNHTEGPWRVAEMRHKYDVVIRDVNGAPVALGVVAGYPASEAEANARLIAAAPELLAALDALEAYARGFSVSGVCLEDEIEGGRLLANACDAIAKATGE